MFKNKLFIFTVLVAGISNSFAASNDCKNLTEIAVGHRSKLTFCDVDKNLQFSRYEVTRAQYATVMGQRPWLKHYAEGVFENPNAPATYISHSQAMQFARALSLIDPLANYRLPTDAEFHHATFGNDPTNLYCGKNFDPNYAFLSEAPYGIFGKRLQSVNKCPNSLMDARTPGYCANGFGLMHMVGNAHEMADDIAGQSIPEVKNALMGIVGGDFSDSARDVDCREDGSPLYRVWIYAYGYAETSFRLVRILK